MPYRFISALFLAVFLVEAVPALADHDVDPNRPTNEIPMYGPDADQKPDGQNPEASLGTAKLGFDYFFKGDTATAIKRFNQAWMLDRNNGLAYWGFAMILDTRDHDFAGAERMMIKAESLLSKDAALQKDFGMLYGRNKKHEQALGKFQKAAELDPSLPNIHRELSTAYFFLEDIPNSLKHAKLSQAADDKLDPKWMGLLTCLDEKMKAGMELIPAGRQCL